MCVNVNVTCVFGIRESLLASNASNGTMALPPSLPVQPAMVMPPPPQDMTAADFVINYFDVFNEANITKTMELFDMVCYVPNTFIYRHVHVVLIILINLSID